jgi:hypothetical protein
VVLSPRFELCFLEDVLGPALTADDLKHLLEDTSLGDFVVEHRLLENNEVSD